MPSCGKNCQQNECGSKKIFLTKIAFHFCPSWTAWCQDFLRQTRISQLKCTCLKFLICDQFDTDCSCWIASSTAIICSRFVSIHIRFVTNMKHEPTFYTLMNEQTYLQVYIQYFSSIAYIQIGENNYNYDDTKQNKINSL